MAEIVFGIDKAKAQFEFLEKAAAESARKIEETLSKVNPNISQTTGVATQQAKTQAIISESQAKQVATVAKGERDKTQIQIKEALLREQLAQKEAKTKLAILQQQQAQEKLLYMQARRQAFEDKPQGFEGLVERRLSWMASGAMLFGGFSALSGVMSTVKEVEYGMSTIARITEDVTFNFKEMRDELQDLAIEYGMQWAEVSDIATRWAQAGYNVAETLELTRSSLLALNTAELDAQYATQGLIAIMAQWQLQSSDLLTVIDKINKTADNYAVSSQDIVDGLNRTGAAAKNAGMSIEETIAAVTVLREASGRTGREVGTALNTIFSYMTRDKTIKTMESLGIRVFVDEARTQFRSLIDLMKELADRWQETGVSSQLMREIETELLESFNEEMAAAIGLQEEWNDMQQRDISQAAAGVRRRNFFISLMSRFSQIQEVVNQQLDAEGYSMRENERTMGTLEKQTIALRAAMEQLAVAIGDAGLLNEIKGLVEGTKNAIVAFNNLDERTQTFLFTLAEITLAVKLLSAALKWLGVSGVAAGVGGWIASMGQAAVASRSLVSVLAGLKTLLANIGRVAIGALGGPVTAAIIGVSTVALTLKRNLENSNAQFIEQAEIAANLMDQYDSLTEKLGRLDKDSEEYTATLGKLNDVKSQIASSIPQVIDGWDEETNSIRINREEMARMIETSENMQNSLKDAGEEIEEITKRLQQSQQEHNKLMAEWANQENTLNNLIKRREELTKALEKQAEGSEEYNAILKTLADTEKLIADIAEKAGLKRNATADEIIKKIEELKIASFEKLKNTQENERKEVEAVRDATRERLRILNEELKAYQSVLKGGQWYEYRPFFLKGKYNILPGGEFWAQREVAKRQEEIAKVNKELEETELQLKVLDDAIRGIDNSINEISSSSLTKDYPAPLGSTSSTGKSIDEISEALNALADSSRKYEVINIALDTTLGRLSRGLSLVSAEYDFLVRKVETGIATTEDYARMQELLASKQYYLQEEQRQLTLANQEYQRQIDALTPLLVKAKDAYIKFQQAGDAKHMEDAAKAVSSLQREIDSLSSAIVSNTQKVWENKSALESLTRQAYTEYYNQAMAWMNHMQAIGRMSVQQQYEYLKTFDETQLDRSEAWKLEEALYQARRNLLRDEMNNIKRAYDEKMRQYEREIEVNDELIERKEKYIDTIKAEADTQIAAIQRLIDALNEEEDLENKEEAERQHNKKIAELIEQRQYHELRTGIEHQDAIKKINDQIAEEERAWQLKQNQWARDAQKKALQDQIDSIREQTKKREDSIRQEINDIKKANDTKRQEMQRHYNEMERLLNDNVLNMLAAIGSANEQMFQKGLELMRSYARGLAQGRSEISRDFKDFFGSEVGKAYNNISGGTGSSGTGKDSPPSEPKPSSGNSLGTKEQAHARAEAAREQLRYLGYSQGVNDISSYTTYEGTLGWYNTYIKNRTDLSQQVKNLFWEIVEARRIWTQLDQAHTGAYVKTSGVAELLKGEKVLSPKLTVSFDRLSEILLSKPRTLDNLSNGFNNSSIERKLDTLISTLNNILSRGIINVEKAVNIEHVSFEDRTDMQAFAIETRAILTARG